ncbi:hypothetical protein MRX96_016341 [Rhipicephalus microplus]
MSNHRPPMLHTNTGKLLLDFRTQGSSGPVVSAPWPAVSGTRTAAFFPIFGTIPDGLIPTSTRYADASFEEFCRQTNDFVALFSQ